MKYLIRFKCSIKRRTFAFCRYGPHISHVPRGDLGSGPSLKMGEGARVTERSLTGKTRDFRATNNKVCIFFKNEGLFDLPRSEKRNKELYIF